MSHPDASPVPAPAPSRRTVPGRARGWLLPAGLALATAGLVGGLLLGQGMVEQDIVPVTDATSLGFVRDMSTHHAQAVRMSEIAHRRSTDPDLNYLAFDILSTQQGQIGIMSGWLQLWEQPSSGDAPTMAWMGHTGPMPGMASDAEITQLDDLPVPQMEEQFLRLMIRHHRGAVPMAAAAASGAASPEVKLIAEQMRDGQQSEVDLMQSMLAARGAAPEPDSTTAEHGAGSGHSPAPAAASHASH
jgi:uncharacterized protein (DUF305 family)